MMAVGNTLPKVIVKDSKGTAVPADELKMPCVLYFYPKADTPGCTNEAKDFTAFAADFEKAGVTVYGVSKDKPVKLAKFADKYGLAVTLLSDEESDLTERMGAWVEKSMYGKKYMGIERCTFLIGKDGKVAQIWRNVKVKGHAEEVLAAAKAL
ncbi:MAG: peroxiredoxin [Sphingorhabdus sp.]